MKKGQLVLWWCSNTTGKLEIEVDTVASAVMLYNGLVYSQTDDDSIGMNIGGLLYYDPLIIKNNPNYDSEDGIADFHTIDCQEFTELVDELEENDAFKKFDIIKYFKAHNIKGEIDEIKMY